jgi:hypothetical protein
LAAFFIESTKAADVGLMRMRNSISACEREVLTAKARLQKGNQEEEECDRPARVCQDEQRAPEVAWVQAYNAA